MRGHRLVLCDSFPTTNIKFQRQDRLNWVLFIVNLFVTNFSKTLPAALKEMREGNAQIFTVEQSAGGWDRAKVWEFKFQTEQV